MVVMRKNEIYEFKYEFRTQVKRKKSREVPSFGMPSAHAKSLPNAEPNRMPSHFPYKLALFS